jgi:hypothetical protein
MTDVYSPGEIVQSLVENLRTYYVFPGLAEEICAHLLTRLEEGGYDGLDEGEYLALALTTDMQQVSGDLHLWVRWHPEPLPEHRGSLLQNPEKVVELKERSRLQNYGVPKVERLAGNVGLVEIRRFDRTSWGSAETLIAAMNLVANASAVIVDLRNCMGGNPGAVALVSSYFFGNDPIHLNSLYWREEDVTEQYWTLPHVPGKRMISIPLFILTAEATFSAGEEFAYNMQALKRATLVGEATGGGAHPGSPRRLHAHFEAFIPNGRAINPITKTNWEGVGVQPDVAVPPEDALQEAHRMALEIVVAGIPEQRSRPLQLLLEEARQALRELAEV